MSLLLLFELVTERNNVEMQYEINIWNYLQADYRWENLRQLPVVPRLFVMMLLFLLLLHVYWTYLIIKIAIKSVQGNIDDIREESDDETPCASSAADGIVMNNVKKVNKVE